MQFSAPDASPAHQELRRIAGSPIEEVLRSLLWLTNAHCDLIALPLVCRNVQKILAAADEEWDVSLSDWLIDEWDEALELVLQEKDRLQEAIGDKFDSGFDEMGNHPLMRSGIARYSVYAALCNSHELEELQPRYRLLQAHLLIAHARAMRKFTTLRDYETHSGGEEPLRDKANPYLAALAVRELSTVRRRSLLESLPVDQPPGEFLKALQEVEPDISSDSGRFIDLTVFFQKALGNRKQGKRNARSGGRKGGGPRIHGKGEFNYYLEEELDMEDPDEPNAPRVTIRRQLGATLKERKALLKDDICPYETWEEEELDCTSFPDPAFDKDPGAFQQAAVTQSNHVVMANQMFSWTYGRLALPEIRHLLIDEPARMRSLLASRPLVQKELDRLEILALLQVMFWTASLQERARHLMFFRRRTSKDIELALVARTDGEMPRWRIRVPLHPVEIGKSDATDGTVRSRTEFLELPDVADGSLLVRELLAQQGRFGYGTNRNDLRSDSDTKASRTSARVFRKSREWYEWKVKALLSEGDSQSRVTRTRIANVMLTRVLSEAKGDLTAAAIITGRRLPLAHVKLFYACPSVRRLQSIYCKAAASVDRELSSLAGSAPVRKAPISFDPGEKYVCNRACPTVQAVRDAIRRLQDEMNRSSRYTTHAGFRRYHNLYTLFTCLFFSYTTGVRGIHTPYLLLSSIDPVHGFTTLTDKDSGTKYKTRLAWIMPELQEQMRHYQDHINRTPILPVATDLPVFFLDDEMNPVEVSPKTALPFLRNFLNFPINIHRRFISAELLDRGCPPEVVDAWMGHWHRGEEPWAQFSTFSFEHYKRALKSYLAPLLLDTIGFRAIRGFSFIRGLQ
jgi:hypothetical protein